MSVIDWLLGPVDPLAAFDEPFDVHSFRALERLKVHEARTDADLGSCAGKVTTSRHLFLVRGQARREAA